MFLGKGGDYLDYSFKEPPAKPAMRNSLSFVKKTIFQTSNRNFQCNNHQWNNKKGAGVRWNFPSPPRDQPTKGRNCAIWSRWVFSPQWGCPLFCRELLFVPIFLTKFTKSSLIYMGFAWRSKTDMQCSGALFSPWDLALMQLIEVYHASLLFWCMCVCSLWTGASASTMKGERERERSNKKHNDNIYIYIEIKPTWLYNKLKNQSYNKHTYYIIYSIIYVHHKLIIDNR